MFFILQKASEQHNIDDDGAKWKWLTFERCELSAHCETFRWKNVCSKPLIYDYENNKKKSKLLKYKFLIYLFVLQCYFHQDINQQTSIKIRVYMLSYSFNGFSVRCPVFVYPYQSFAHFQTLISLRRLCLWRSHKFGTVSYRLTSASQKSRATPCHITKAHIHI